MSPENNEMDIQQEMPGIDHQGAALSTGCETPATRCGHGVRSGELSAWIKQTGQKIRHSREDHFAGVS